MRRLHAGLLAALLGSTVLAGCGSDSEDTGSETKNAALEQVKVSGDFGSKPTITIDKAPLKVEESASREDVEGKGGDLPADAQMLLQLTLASAKSGKTLASTYDEGRPITTPAGQQGLFPSLSEALKKKKVGSRVTVVSTPEDAYGENGAEQIGIAKDEPIVFVADIVGGPPSDVLDKPSGTAVAPAEGSPKLVETKGVPTGFDFAGTKPPKKLTVVPLIKGDGAVVKDKTMATFNYLGAVWKSAKPFDESYTKEPFTTGLGFGSVIKGWDQGLVGQTVGSRVLLLIPAADGYGAQGSPPTIPANATLAFVVDILGAN